MTEKKKPTQDLQDIDDLDTFARALLNKKTEMKIFDETIETTDAAETADPTPRQEAEKTMSAALDSLRRSRGQKTIEEEEQDLASSIFENTAEDNAALVRSIIEENKREAAQKDASAPKKKYKAPRPVKKKWKKDDKNKKAAKPETPQELKREPAPDTSAEPRKPMDPRKKKLLIYIGCFCLLVAAAFGVYAWKVLVYNPEHVVTAEQQKSYDKLVDYADEYGSGLMSDAEKAEILDLKADYDSLAPSQKTRINAYFREQTKTEENPDGKTFTDIWEEENALKQAQDDQNKPEYQQLLAFISNWNEKSEEDRRTIVNYKDIYNSLSQTLKKEIDDNLRSQTGQTFNSLLSAQQEVIRSQEVQAQQRQQQIQDLQAQLDDLNAQISDAQTYGQELANEIAASQQQGQDVTDLQNSLASNDQYIADLNNQAQTIQNQIAALQAEQ